MPHFKCSQCHHEFDQIIVSDENYSPLCDWCGEPSYILEKKIPLERMCEVLNKNLKEKQKLF